jgi:ribose/xylose/arabinose/galactoside ABC-type transport system permease subunit
MKASKRRVTRWLERYLSLNFLLAIIVVFSVFVDRFMTFGNLLSIVSEWTILATLALGFTFVIVVAEFDLSFGYLLGLCSVAAALMLNSEMNFFLMLLCVVLIGVAVGAFNGFLIVKIGLPAFIATIGVGAMCQGANYFFTKAAPIEIRPGVLPGAFLFVGQGSFLSLPGTLVVFVPLTLLVIYILNQSRLGRHLYVLGINPDAARKVGINVGRGKIFAMICSGVGAAIVGLLSTARTSSGNAIAGPEYLLDVFASVFFGMSLFKEGEANVGGTLVGALFMVVVGNGFMLMNMPFYYLKIAQGIVILLGLGVVSLIRKQYSRT